MTVLAWIGGYLVVFALVAVMSEKLTPAVAIGGLLLGLAIARVLG